MTPNQGGLTISSPPSGGEHDAPVHLISGYPRRVAVILGLLLGSASLLAINLSVMNAWVAVPASVCICVVSIHWVWATLSAQDKSLVIFPDGEVYCLGLKAIALRGELQKRSWRRSQLACIEVRFPWGVERYVIFSRLQRRDDYRRLSVWLLHSRTDVPNSDL